MKLVKQGSHAALVVLLFLIAMITDFLTPQDSNLYPMIGYLACCLLGIVPILTAAFDALCRKQVCFCCCCWALLLMMISVTEIFY